MAENTEISWADDTFNPWVGCTKIGPACDGCYAEHLMDTRHHRVKWGNHPRARTSESNWAKPIRWNKDAAKAGKPRFVFCASLADVFDNQVPAEWRRDLFDLIHKTPALTWLLLTKRPQNIVKLFAEAITPELRAKWSPQVALGRSLWPHNAAIGCTVVTQAEADRDIPILLAAKAALNPAFAFVSMEPLLGPVDLTRIDMTDHGFDFVDALRGERRLMHPQAGGQPRPCPKLDWVITGGETGQGLHKARPQHPDWYRSLRDQCAAAGVPFHHKQNGEWLPVIEPEPDSRHVLMDVHGRQNDDIPEPAPGDDGAPYWGAWYMQRVGKKAAGRLLDGVTHDARPGVRP